MPDDAQTTFQFTTSAETEEPDFLGTVPDAYKEKEWVKNIARSENPREELFRQYESAQSLIGRQKGLEIPGDGATPEQIKTFHKQLGVPEDITGYEIKPVEWSDEDREVGKYLSDTRTEDLMNAIKTAAHVSGVTPKQLQSLADAYDKAFVGQYKQTISTILADEKTLNADFEAQAKQMFGERTQSVLDNGRKIIEQSVPEQARKSLEKLDNAALLVLAAALDGVRQKYIKEDSFTQSGAASSVSLQDIQAEGRRLMAQPAYADPLHPQHDSAVQAVRANYERLKSLSK